MARNGRKQLEMAIMPENGLKWLATKWQDMAENGCKSLNI